MTEGVGIHTIRKTAYIRAVYYPRGKLELIKAAARHKNIQSAERYYRAAQGQFDMDKAANDSSFTNLSAWILNNKVDCRRWSSFWHSGASYPVWRCKVQVP